MTITKAQAARLHKLYSETLPALDRMLDRAHGACLFGVHIEGSWLFDLAPVGAGMDPRANAIRDAVVRRLFNERELAIGEIKSLGGEEPA